MIDIKKQIEYWFTNAEYDIETAELLISQNKILHGLFFCHLSIEKAIKAHFVKIKKEIPPKTHNLIYLSEVTGIELNEEKNLLLGVLMRFQLEGRYPEYQPVIPSKEKASEYLSASKDLVQWLKKRL